jgi:hypothetical protein
MEVNSNHLFVRRNVFLRQKVFGFQKSFADIKTLILMDISSVGQTE